MTESISTIEDKIKQVCEDIRFTNYAIAQWESWFVDRRCDYAELEVNLHDLQYQLGVDTRRLHELLRTRTLTLIQKP